MKWFMKILLAAFIMFVASAAPVYADDDEGNEPTRTGPAPIQRMMKKRAHPALRSPLRSPELLRQLVFSKPECSKALLNPYSLFLKYRNG